VAKYSVLRSFYASETWIKFRLAIIAERGPVCQKCKRVIGNSIDCTLHHAKELTPENVADASLSLNPENVLVVCHDCHNQIHHRFGHHTAHGTYIVFGPPMSGKSTYVSQNMSRGDLVIDMDLLYAAISLLPEYDKPDSLFRNVIGVYNLLIDNVKTRYGKWNSAWVVGGLADRYRREQLANNLGAELIFCDVSRLECLGRLEMDEGRRSRKDQWASYINKWFDEYTL
jgi:hypothetical protein